MYKISDVYDFSIEDILDFYSSELLLNKNVFEKKLLDKYNNKELVGRIAHDESGIIGIYLTQFQNLNSRKEDIAVQSIDTLIRRDKRSGFLIKKLFNLVCKDLREAKVRFIFGVPNEQFSRVIYPVLKWKKISNTKRLIVLIPIPLLKIVGFFIKSSVKLNNGVVSSGKFEAVIKRRNYFCDVGCLRKFNHSLSIMDLALISKHAEGLFFRTYCTPGSITHDLISPFSYSSDSLDFSVFKLDKDLDMDRFEIEYNEYDTY